MPDNSRVTTTILLATFAAWLADDLDFDFAREYGVPAEDQADWLYDSADRFMDTIGAGGVFVVADDSRPALTLQARMDAAGLQRIDCGG